MDDVSMEVGLTADCHGEDYEQQQQEEGAGGEEVGEDSMEEPPSEEQLPRCQLEDYTRCSESHLWKLMMSFYDRKGVESWSHGIVPHFITCNAFIGRSYANVLKAFLRDCMSPTSSMKLDTEEPLYIVELGTGSGKFSFFMLKALQEMKETSSFPVDKIVYVMTDFTAANFNYWKDHPSLKPYLDAGVLDMAIFDAVNDSTITLAHQGTVLAPGTVKNPICVVANYLFDTLCQDVFQVERGVLKEGLISVGTTREKEPDPLEPDIIKRMNNKYEYRPISDDYYKDEQDREHLQRILQWYVDYFAEEEEEEEGERNGRDENRRKSRGGGRTPAASLLMPIGAVRAIRQLCSFSDNRALVISGDKGNNNPEQFRGLMDPHIAVHGSFSVMVNYHAIGAYFTSRGGFALHNPQEEASLKVSTFVLTGDEKGEGEGTSSDDGDWLKGALERRDEERKTKYPHLAEAFKNHIEHFGPNDFFVMQKGLKEDAPTPSLKSIVALLKLGDWDPDVFFKFRESILNQVPTAGAKLRKDLCRGVPRVWENYYPLDKDKDVAFEVGRFYYGIRDYEKALQYYANSSENIGAHHVTYHNMGLCHYSLGTLKNSLFFFEKALAMNSQYQKAENWRQKVEDELRGPVEGAAGASLPVEEVAAVASAATAAAAAAAEQGGSEAGGGGVAGEEDVEGDGDVDNVNASLSTEAAILAAAAAAAVVEGRRDVGDYSILVGDAPSRGSEESGVVAGLAALSAQ